jgi:multidrug efflux system outer membrane protein
VSQARADLAFTRSAIPATERLIAIKEHELSVLLGRPPGPIDRGAPLVSTPIPPALPAGVPAQLLERRPDVLAAEQGIVAAGKRVGVAVANRLPQISLAGLIGREAREASNVFTSNALLWNAGGSLLAPVFQGGRLKSAEEAARTRLEQSVAAYRKAVEVALREVVDAAVGVQKLRFVRIEQETQVKATTEAARLALLRYEGGVSSYLEVLDAQRQQYDAELSLARTRRDELASVVQLYRALGGGWGREEAKPEAAAPAGQPPGGGASGEKG